MREEQKQLSGRLTDQKLRNYVLSRGGVLTLGVTLAPSG